MKKVLAILLVLCIYVVPVMASAHSGGTDENGGHYDDDGDYHYHHGQPAHDHYDMDGDGDIDCPYDFEDGTKPSNGAGTGNSYDTHTSYGYSDGYRDGYEKGYKDGEIDGKDYGYKKGYSAGERDKADEMERQFEEQLKERESSAIIATIVVTVILGWPVFMWFKLWYIPGKIAEKEAGYKEEIRELKKSWQTYQDAVFEPPVSSVAKEEEEREKSETWITLPEKSDAITAAKFTNGALYITFAGGAKRAYFNVYEDTYKGLMEAEDKEKFYLDNIYEKFPFGIVHE